MYMKILLIEDDTADIEFISEVLVGHEIEVYNTLPKESLRNTYDLIILDYFYEGNTAREFIKNLTQGTFSFTPIIIISGRIGEIDLSDVPVELNALILSKNEKFQSLLPYYVNLITDQKQNKDFLDYQTLFMSLVHDLRNDLGVTQYYGQILNSENRTPDDIEFVKELIIKNALFGYSRLEHLGEFLTHDGQVYGDLTSAFKMISDSELVKGNRSEISLKGEIHTSINFISTYFLSVILKNFIENSQRYADPERSLKIDIFFEEKDNHFSLSISDNAKGMSDDQVRNLFCKKQDSELGLGVGLIVINRIISAHRGKIAIDSTEGKGTNVRVNFFKEDLSPNGR